MPEPTTTSTATARDIPVLPDVSIRYEQLPPTGRPHAVYRVEATEPAQRNDDR